MRSEPLTGCYTSPTRKGRLRFVSSAADGSTSTCIFCKRKTMREREREREHAVSLSACGLSLGLPFVLHVISIFSRDAETFRMCLLS